MEKRISNKKLLRELVFQKNHTIEMGGLTLGENTPFETNVLKAIKDHSNFFVITCFHHPLNWLQYGIKYSGDAKKNNKLILNQVLNKTELLLTGHEHVPSSVSHEKLNHHALHLKGGMFMQDNMFQQIVGQARFSILEIDTTRFILTENKYIYDVSESKWRYDKDFSQNKIPIQLRLANFNKERIPFWTSLLKEEKNIIKIFDKFFYYTTEASSFFDTDLCLQTDQYYIIRFSKEKIAQKILVVITDETFYQSYLKWEANKNNSPHIFSIIINSIQDFHPLLTICLVVPDFFVSQDLTKKYEHERGKCDEIYGQIVKTADFLFNVGRHRFFNQYEDLYTYETKDELIVNNISLNKIRNIQFSQQIIPFWFIDKIQ